MYGSTKVTLTSTDTTVTTTQNGDADRPGRAATSSTVALSGTVRIYDNKKLIATVTMPSTGKVSSAGRPVDPRHAQPDGDVPGNSWYTVVHLGCGHREGPLTDRLSDGLRRGLTVVRIVR